MILIGIGANLPSPRYGEPRATCGAALSVLAEAPLSFAARSRWYKSAPVPVSDQPWFINGVVHVKTALDPVALMALLLETEEAFGRKRAGRNEARVLDLDLLAFGDMVCKPHQGESESGGAGTLHLPHPRLHERAFVLQPLLDIAPDWRHPVSGQSVRDMIEALPPTQKTESIPDAGGDFGTEWRETNAIEGESPG